MVSERIDPHYFVLKPIIAKKSHDQLRMDNHDVRNGSHDSGNAALRLVVSHCNILSRYDNFISLL